MNPCINVVGKQNPDKNIIYLKTKELLYQSNMARESERFKLEGTVETGPQTQFSQFLLVLWFEGMYLRLKIKVSMGYPVHSNTN